MLIMSKACSLVISLNIFLMSKDVKHRIRGFVFNSEVGLVIYLLISALMLWYTQFAPPFTPIA